MLCTKCKNPIDDHATKCEWCGMSFSIIENDRHEQQSEKPKTNELDTELISLLEQGYKQQAVAYYRKRTGANESDSRNYIARLNFFLHHEHATEDIWRNYSKKSKRSRFLSRLTAWIVLPFAFFMWMVLFFGISENENKDNGLVVFLLIFNSIITFLPVFWVYKVKKNKI